MQSELINLGLLFWQGITSLISVKNLHFSVLEGSDKKTSNLYGLRLKSSSNTKIPLSETSIYKQNNLSASILDFVLIYALEKT
jgi:hypothetical protein